MTSFFSAIFKKVKIYAFKFAKHDLGGHMNFPGGAVVKNPLANAGDRSSIPGSGRSLEKEMETHSNILYWKIP